MVLEELVMTAFETLAVGTKVRVKGGPIDEMFGRIGEVIRVDSGYNRVVLEDWSDLEWMKPSVLLRTEEVEVVSESKGFEVGDIVRINDPGDSLFHGEVFAVVKTSTLGGSYTLLDGAHRPDMHNRPVDFNWTTKSLELVGPETVDPLNDVGQEYLDLLNAAVKDGRINDDIWTLGFIHAFINDIEDALS
jgi:hypothetical protein